MKIYLIKKKKHISNIPPSLICKQCSIKNNISLSNDGLCINCFNQKYPENVHLVNKNMTFLCVDDYSISTEFQNLLAQKNKHDMNLDFQYNNEEMSLKYFGLSIYSIFTFIVLFISIFIYGDYYNNNNYEDNNFCITYYIFCTLLSFLIISLFIYEIIKNNENLDFIRKLTSYKYTDQLKNILITNIFMVVSVIIQLIKINNYYKNNNNDYKELGYFSIKYEVIILIQLWVNIQFISILYNLKKKRFSQSSKIKKLIIKNIIVS